jgi:hypothetical protein
VHRHAVKWAFGAELALQVVQVLVCVPLAENVPASQLTTTALDVELQADVTRCPGPAVEQAEHVPSKHVAFVPPTQYWLPEHAAAAPPTSSAAARTRSASASAMCRLLPVAVQAQAQAHAHAHAQAQAGHARPRAAHAAWRMLPSPSPHPRGRREKV